MKTFLLATMIFASVISCSEDFSDCALGRLSGTWRAHYVEIDGTCGPISDETVILGGTPSACTASVNEVSENECRLDVAFVCPTTDGLGSTSWVMVMHHVDADLVDGTATVQLSHPDGSCRSTYDISVTQL